MRGIKAYLYKQNENELEAEKIVRIKVALL